MDDRLIHPSKIQDSRLPQLLNSFTELKKRPDLGFLDLPRLQEPLLQCRRRVAEIKDSYDTLVVLGIGGSSLGAKVLKDFATSNKKKKLQIIETPEESQLRDFFCDCPDLSRVHWAVISKSGTTLESLAQVSWVASELAQQSIEISRHSTVITEFKPSPLYNWAQQNQIPCLEIPQSVGGRFSVLSTVGLFPGEWLGLDLEEVLSGAGIALEKADLVASLAFLALESFERNEWITVFWSYGQKWQHLGLWWQQLWAESLAKRGGPRVSTPLVLTGPMDQHSVLQQIAHGERDKWLWMWKSRAVVPSEKNGLNCPFDSAWHLEKKSLNEILEVQYRATCEALKNENVSLLELRPLDESPRTLGFILMSFQLLIGVLGEYFEINAFDQPGVEEGKKIAQRLLASQGDKRQD